MFNPITTNGREIKMKGFNTSIEIFRQTIDSVEISHSPQYKESLNLGKIDYGLWTMGHKQ